MPLPIKMVAVDIDGTLLASPGTVVSRRNCRALRDAEAAGIEIVIATGRRQAYAMPLIEPVGLKPDKALVVTGRIRLSCRSSATFGSAFPTR